jgi:hypothetical protein
MVEINYSELEEIEMDPKLRAIMVAMLQNISVLNMVVARLAQVTGLLPDESSGDEAPTGQYL